MEGVLPVPNVLRLVNQELLRVDDEGEQFDEHGRDGGDGQDILQQLVGEGMVGLDEKTGQFSMRA